MWGMEIAGVSLYYILNWFFIYSFLGWLWESCYVSVKSGKAVNRGFINGPFCTLYGCGALSVYLILKPFSANMVMLYVGGVVIATVLEYVTGWLMETVFHTRWWDYSKNKFNIQGRICLGSSLAWGIFTILLFKILQPFVVWIVGLYSMRTGVIVVSVLCVYYIVDFTTSVTAAFKLSSGFAKMEDILEEFAAYAQKTKLYETTEEIRERLRDSKQGVSYRAKKQQLAEKRIEFMNRLEEAYQTADSNYAVKKEELGQRYDEFTKKYMAFRKNRGVGSKRMMKAYPNLLKEFEKYRDRKKKNH